jgi:uncharacterized metal-binding protein YceD (DUF177 family)
MEALKEHTIPFTGLKDGRHEFEFMLDEPFFKTMADEEIMGGDAVAEVALDKTPTMLVTNIHVKGTVRVHCDHCGALLDQAIDGSQRQIFQLHGEVNGEPEDDELITLDSHAHSINLTHYIYECLRLALPARRVHAPGQCDPAAEEALGRLAVEHEHVPDPRWDALKELKNKRP